MDKIKVLMIGPGSPDAANAGLGLVVDELKKVLSTKLSLISIEPKDVKGGEKEELVTSFSEKEVVQDLVRISISTTIDPYSYFEPVTEQEVESKESEVKKIYEEFTESVTKASGQHDFDLIYAHDWIGMEAAMELQEQSGKPLVLHIHSLDIDRLGANHKSWIYDIERLAILKADAIIAVSEYTKNRIVDNYSGDPAKITVAYPGIPALSRRKAKTNPVDKIHRLVALGLEPINRG